MENNLTQEKEVVKEQYWETITIEKFKDEERVKIMSFTVKASEKSNLSKLVMDLLITIAQKQGYASYFDSKAIDPFASKTFEG